MSTLSGGAPAVLADVNQWRERKRINAGIGVRDDRDDQLTMVILHQAFEYLLVPAATQRPSCSILMKWSRGHIPNSFDVRPSLELLRAV